MTEEGFMHEKFAERIAKVYIEKSIKHGQGAANTWISKHLKGDSRHIAQVAIEVRRLTDWSGK